MPKLATKVAKCTSAVRRNGGRKCETKRRDALMLMEAKGERKDLIMLNEILAIQRL